MDGRDADVETARTIRPHMLTERKLRAAAKVKRGGKLAAAWLTRLEKGSESRSSGADLYARW
jgi:hypothetical protein